MVGVGNRRMGPADSPPAQQARRQAGPVTDKGQARRLELLAAARRVFERKGFLDARVADIVQEANVAQGTFYSYFDSKDAVFREVAQEATRSMLEALHTEVHYEDPIVRTHAAMRRFVEAYRPHAKIIALIEQVGTFTPAMRELRLTLREAFVQRTVQGLKRLQAEGHADPDADVELLAELLGAMVDHTCYIWFSLGKEFDEDRLLDGLTRIWTRAVGVRPAAKPVER